MRYNIEIVSFEETTFDTSSAEKWLRNQKLKKIGPVSRNGKYLLYKIKTSRRDEKFITVKIEDGVVYFLTYDYGLEEK